LSEKNKNIMKHNLLKGEVVKRDEKRTCFIVINALRVHAKA